MQIVMNTASQSRIRERVGEREPNTGREKEKEKESERGREEEKETGPLN